MEQAGHLHVELGESWLRTMPAAFQCTLRADVALTDKGRRQQTDTSVDESAGGIS